MIRHIQLLQSVGQFDYVAAGAIVLRRNVFVYAENGRGKTTLTAILRSLATGDGMAIRERARLAAVNPPHVVLACSNHPDPLVFQDGAWNRLFPQIVIFDDRFVDENICSGLSVEPGHRQKLHELVIGAQGVTLNRRHQYLVDQIEVHNANLRAREAAIPYDARFGLTVEDFCDLPAIDNVETRIVEGERDLAAALQQDRIRQTPEFSAVQTPVFDLPAVDLVLESDLPNVEAAAVDHVQRHFHDLGPHLEARPGPPKESEE